ncbi:hypothetical protein [Mammaliicoccus sp. J-M41]|uniref:hypothetical protein n=1 Tax=Mammaliicoccus sp. J-M41 TaxID=2898700 RepID=UPI001EFB4D87|nr:hypothetical protein [Mammaliicoccus sp. J-M41]
MNKKNIQENLKILFKDEGMKQVILAAVDISKDDHLTRREKRQLLKIEKITKQL